MQQEEQLRVMREHVMVLVRVYSDIIRDIGNDDRRLYNDLVRKLDRKLALA